MDDDFENWLASRGTEASVNEGELSPDTVVDGYRIVAHLGRGGFADMYKAEACDGAVVAVKMLHRLDEKSRARFARESGILSLVKHDSFPQMLGSGMFNGRPYIVMEFLVNRDLPAGDGSVADFLMRVASAVGELHRHGYVHRDVKPANILARADGTPVLIDFGLACPASSIKREQDALSIDDGKPVVVGTLGYAAPEQISGQGAGPEADVHAIGMLIADCFCGRIPRCWRRIHLTATTSDLKSRYKSVFALEKAIRSRHRLQHLLIAVLGASLLGVVTYFCCRQDTPSGVTSQDEERNPVKVTPRDNTPTVMIHESAI